MPFNFLFRQLTSILLENYFGHSYCLAGKRKESTERTTTTEKQDNQSREPAERGCAVTEICRARSAEFFNTVREPLEAKRNEREKADPGSRERAPRKLIEEIGINSNRKKEFSGFSLDGRVYKEVPVPGGTAQSSSTNEKNSIGSSTRIVIPGTVDWTSSCRTPRPLLALAYEKKVQSPIGHPETQFPGTLRGLVTIDWQSTPGRESKLTWPSPVSC